MDAAAQRWPDSTIRSLKDAVYYSRRWLSPKIVKWMKQLNAAYSLSRHCSSADIQRRADEVASELRGSVDQQQPGTFDPWAAAAAAQFGEAFIAQADAPRAPRPRVAPRGTPRVRLDDPLLRLLPRHDRGYRGGRADAANAADAAEARPCRRPWWRTGRPGARSRFGCSDRRPRGAERGVARRPRGAGRVVCRGC